MYLIRQVYALVDKQVHLSRIKSMRENVLYKYFGFEVYYQLAITNFVALCFRDKRGESRRDRDMYGRHNYFRGNNDTVFILEIQMGNW